MNHRLLKADRNLVCTCNEIYQQQIVESAELGCIEPEEVFYEQAALFKCDECRPRVQHIIRKTLAKSSV